MVNRISEIFNLLTAPSFKIKKMAQEFMADMSHELRTPLTKANLLSGSMLTDEYGPLTKKQRDFITSINKGSNEVLDVWNDVLTVYWLFQGRGELNFEEVDLTLFIDSLVAKVLDHYRLKHRSFVNIEVISEELPNIQADVSRLDQAIMWILAEIIYPYDHEEYQESKTTIRLVKDNHWVKLDITTDEKTHLCDYVDTNHMWYFSKKIIEKHNGKLQLYSLSEQKTGILVTLPVHQKRLSKRKYFCWPLAKNAP